MVPSLPLLSCESSVSVKENPDRKKNYSTCTLQNDNFIRITLVGRLSGGWQYSHANKSNTVIAKEDVESFPVAI